MNKVKFGVSQIGNPTPPTWARISEALRYFFVGAITTVSATDVIPDHIVKYVTLGLSLAILSLKSVDLGLGIAPANPPQSPENPPQ